GRAIDPLDVQPGPVRWLAYRANGRSLRAVTDHGGGQSRDKAAAVGYPRRKRTAPAPGRVQSRPKCGAGADLCRVVRAAGEARAECHRRGVWRLAPDL